MYFMLASNPLAANALRYIGAASANTPLSADMLETRRAIISGMFRSMDCG